MLLNYLLLSSSYRLFFVPAPSSVTMGLSPRLLRLLKFIIPISVLILIGAYLLTPKEYLPLSSSEWQTIKSSAAELLHTGKGPGTNVGINNEAILNGKTKGEWIEGAADWEIDAPYNDTALHDLCETKNWNTGLVFKFEPAYGGVGNVRNIALNCLRYAIEAGGKASSMSITSSFSGRSCLIHHLLLQQPSSSSKSEPATPTS